MTPAAVRTFAAAGLTLLPATAAGREQLHLTVQLYDVAGLPNGVLHAAWAEASRMLRTVPVPFQAVECNPPAGASPEPCRRSGPAFLSVRVIKTALPGVTADALGLTTRSDDGESAAAVFYDRAIALRQHGIYLPQILGRAMAHEICHMLLPPGSHAGYGLMLGHWSAADLRTGNLRQEGLPNWVLATIRAEFRRRTLVSEAQHHPEEGGGFRRSNFRAMKYLRPN